MSITRASHSASIDSPTSTAAGCPAPDESEPMASSPPPRSLFHRRTFGPVLLALLVALALLPTVGAVAQNRPTSDADGPAVVTLEIPDRATLDAVVDAGTDLDHDLDAIGSGFEVTGFVWPEEVADLEALGVTLQVEVTGDELEDQRVDLMAERTDAIEEAEAKASVAGVAAIDTVVIARADRFTSLGDQYLSVEAKSTDLQDADLTVEWDAGEGTAIGDGGSAGLSSFVDAGEYQYHRGQFNLSGVITITIDDGAAAGSYGAVGASFGDPFDVAGITGTVEVVNDGSGNPTEGCDPLVDFTPGNIALFDRGSCAFVTKAENAQAAGASVMILANNNDGAPFVMTGGTSATVPSVMISRADGATIRTGLPTEASLAAQEAVVPTRVRVTSANGGSAEAEVSDWLGEPTENPPTYFQGFFDHYPDVYETNEILAELHATFPDLTEIVELPHETNGYRRRAMHLSDGDSAQRVALTSHNWGHEGGNDLTITYAAAGAVDQPVSVSVSSDDIMVTLATDGSGETTSTAADVVASINGDPAASALVVASTYRGSSGDGAVVAEPTASLTDGLNAPDYVKREPFQPLMLRIGKVRDGSNLGVFTYSQEHAREWQTPLVNLETAHRLLYNYSSDRATRELVDNLDIFIVPTVNPDGQLYSYYDFASQRKNMTNYCEPGDPNDFNARNAWGVDNNRNYDVGSVFDGYSGASTTNCTSGTFAGPGELSEPESANVDSVPATYDNIKFAMNIHSSGNYFMWSPGSYKLPGRETLPRPSLGTEDYFFAASKDILTEIQEWRGLAVTPARTGPTADVLYSAAGNSGDMLYYKHDLYAWNFEVGTSFQPGWDEAYEQMMEYSNGVVELYDVARDWDTDRRPPRTSIDQPGSGRYDAPVEITFDANEPVDIYYTLDGSRPDYDSTRWESAGVREGGEDILISETTTIRWFSVDASGNVESAYDPDGSSNRARRTRIVIS